MLINHSPEVSFGVVQWVLGYDVLFGSSIPDRTIRYAPKNSTTVAGFGNEMRYNTGIMEKKYSV